MTDMESVKRAVSAADLHMHSTASDGTDTPQELLSRIRSEGIRVFAVTDHDTDSGALLLKEYYAGLSGKERQALPAFIPGIEFACYTEAGKCHILGYGYDPEAPSFREALEYGRRLRREKLEKRLRHLEERHGIVFTEEELSSIGPSDSVGKPHLAKLIMARGLSDSIGGAIRTFIDDRKKGPGERNERIPGELAVRGILGSGGIPVWAHPLGGEGERHLERGEFEAQLEVLTSFGIRGLECYYSRYTTEECRFLLSEAAGKGLLVSGGSDYHGSNKTIGPGTLNADGTVVPEEALTILGELL